MADPRPPSDEELEQFLRDFYEFLYREEPVLSGDQSVVKNNINAIQSPFYIQLQERPAGLSIDEVWEHITELTKNDRQFINTQYHKLVNDEYFEAEGILEIVTRLFDPESVLVQNNSTLVFKAIAMAPYMESYLRKTYPFVYDDQPAARGSRSRNRSRSGSATRRSDGGAAPAPSNAKTLLTIDDVHAQAENLFAQEVEGWGNDYWLNDGWWDSSEWDALKASLSKEWGVDDTHGFTTESLTPKRIAFLQEVDRWQKIFRLDNGMWPKAQIRRRLSYAIGDEYGLSEGEIDGLYTVLKGISEEKEIPNDEMARKVLPAVSRFLDGKGKSFDLSAAYTAHMAYREETAGDVASFLDKNVQIKSSPYADFAAALCVINAAGGIDKIPALINKAPRYASVPKNETGRYQVFFQKTGEEKQDGVEGKIIVGNVYLQAPDGTMHTFKARTGGRTDVPGLSADASGLPGSEEKLPNSPYGFNGYYPFDWESFAHARNKEPNEFTANNGDYGWLRMGSDPDQTSRGAVIDVDDNGFFGIHMDGDGSEKYGDYDNTDNDGSAGCIALDTNGGYEFFTILQGIPKNQRPLGVSVMAPKGYDVSLDADNAPVAAADTGNSTSRRIPGAGGTSVPEFGPSISLPEDMALKSSTVQDVVPDIDMVVPEQSEENSTEPVVSAEDKAQQAALDAYYDAQNIPDSERIAWIDMTEAEQQQSLQDMQNFELEQQRQQKYQGFWTMYGGGEVVTEDVALPEQPLVQTGTAPDILKKLFVAAGTITDTNVELTRDIIRDGLDAVAADFAETTKNSALKAELEAGGERARNALLANLEKAATEPADDGETWAQKREQILNNMNGVTTASLVVSSLQENGVPEAYAKRPQLFVDAVDNHAVIATYVNDAMTGPGSTQESRVVKTSNANPAFDHFFQTLLIQAGLMKEEDRGKITQEIIDQAKEHDFTELSGNFLNTLDTENYKDSGYNYTEIKKEIIAQHKNNPSYDGQGEDLVALQFFAKGHAFGANPDRINNPPEVLRPSHRVDKDYRETARIVQAGLNVLNGVLQGKGYAIKTPDDLDLKGNGVDGYFGEDGNFCLQQNLMVLRSEVLGKLPDKDGQEWLYKGKDTEDLMLENWTAIVGKLDLTDAQKEALQNVEYKDRFGNVRTFDLLSSPATYFQAMTRLEDPASFLFEDPEYIRRRDNNLTVFQIGDEKLAGVDLPLIPLSYVQREMIDDLPVYVKNMAGDSVLPLVDELCRAYTGQGLGGFVSPDDKGNGLEIKGYTRDDKDSSVNRYRVLFGKAYGAFGGDLDKMEAVLLRSADTISQMPFGTFAQQDGFVGAVRGAMTAAKEAATQAIDAGKTPAEVEQAATRAFQVGLESTLDKNGIKPGAVKFTTEPRIGENGERRLNPAQADFSVGGQFDVADAYIMWQDFKDTHGGQDNLQVFTAKTGTPAEEHIYIAGEKGGYFEMRTVPKTALEAREAIEKAGNTVGSIDDLKAHMPAADYQALVDAYDLASSYRNVQGVNQLLNLAGQNVQEFAILREDVQGAKRDAAKVHVAMGAADQKLQEITVNGKKKAESSFRTKREQELIAADEAAFDKSIVTLFETTANKKAKDRKNDPTWALMKTLDGKTPQEKFAAYQKTPEYVSRKNGYVQDATRKATRDQTLNTDVAAFLLTPAFDQEVQQYVQANMHQVKNAFAGVYGVGGAPALMSSNSMIPIGQTFEIDGYSLEDIARESTQGKRNGHMYFTTDDGMRRVFMNEHSTQIGSILSFTDAELDAMFKSLQAAETALQDGTEYEKLNDERNELHAKRTELDGLKQKARDALNDAEKALKASPDDQDVKDARNKALADLQAAQLKVRENNAAIDDLDQQIKTLLPGNFDKAQEQLIGEYPKLKVLMESYKDHPPPPRVKDVIMYLKTAEPFYGSQAQVAGPKIGSSIDDYNNTAYSRYQDGVTAKSRRDMGIKRRGDETPAQFNRRGTDRITHLGQAHFNPMVEQRGAATYLRYFIPDDEKADAIGVLKGHIADAVENDITLRGLVDQYEEWDEIVKTSAKGSSEEAEANRKLKQLKTDIAAREDQVLTNTGESIADVRRRIRIIDNTHDGTDALRVDDEILFLDNYIATNGKVPTLQEINQMSLPGGKLENLGKIARHYTNAGVTGSQFGGNALGLYQKIKNGEFPHYIPAHPGSVLGNGMGAVGAGSGTGTSPSSPVSGGAYTSTTTTGSAGATASSTLSSGFQKYSSAMSLPIYGAPGDDILGTQTFENLYDEVLDKALRPSSTNKQEALKMVQVFTPHRRKMDQAYLRLEAKQKRLKNRGLRLMEQYNRNGYSEEWKTRMESHNRETEALERRVKKWKEQAVEWAEEENEYWRRQQKKKDFRSTVNGDVSLRELHEQMEKTVDPYRVKTTPTVTTSGGAGNPP